jgi:hypothetical protein
VAHAELAALRKEKEEGREYKKKEKENEWEEEGTAVAKVRELRMKVEEYKQKERAWEEEETKLRDTVAKNEKVWALEKTKLENNLRQLSTQLQDAQVLLLFNLSIVYNLKFQSGAQLQQKTT